MPIPALDNSEQLAELFDAETGLLQNVGQRRALNGPVSGDDQLQCLSRCMLLEPNVTTALPYDEPSIPAERPNHALVAQARDFPHSAISTTSASGERAASSSTGSRYSWIAS